MAATFPPAYYFFLGSRTDALHVNVVVELYPKVIDYYLGKSLEFILDMLKALTHYFHHYFSIEFSLHFG